MIKLGYIGIAHDHAEATMQCIRKYPDIFEIKGIAEENPENIKKYGKYTSYQGLPFMSVEQLLNQKLDAVIVECEELELVKTAQKCIDKGFHVHLDKPAGADAAAFDKLLNEAKVKNLVVQTGYMYRYNSAVQYCKNAVDSGILGEIYQVNAVMNTQHSPEKRAWMKGFPGGNMFYLGCHMVDLVLLMAGAPERIIPMNKKTGFDGVDVYDYGFAVFEYKNGLSTVEATSNEVNGYGRRQLVVCGSKGTIEIKPLEYYIGSDLYSEVYLTLNTMTKGKEYSDCKIKVPIDKMVGRYDAMMLDFAAFIKGEKKNPFGYEYELLVEKALMAACGKEI